MKTVKVLKCLCTETFKGQPFLKTSFLRCELPGYYAYPLARILRVNGLNKYADQKSQKSFPAYLFQACDQVLTPVD